MCSVGASLFPSAARQVRAMMHRLAVQETPQRVRDVTWEQILQHFAVCISDDLEELHRRFIQENIVTFAAWKRLWSDARMSATFHVEFRESSPTNTHKTILQQALDGLVWCIEERGGEFHEAADVAALIGRVFAMYCAYSVQLSAPKLKIDVDPQAWTALLSIDCVMCSVGASLFPSAARQVRAMMHRLAVQESAFLRCLKGFGPSVRVQERARRSLSGGVSASVQDAQTGAEENVPIKQSKVDQLKALNDRYQELMSRTRSAGSASSARIGGRRTQIAGSASLLSTGLPSGTGNDAEELSRTLSAYVEYKANEAARRIERVERAAAVRENESRSANDMDKSDREDRSNILELSDHGSIYSVPTSPMARSVASRSRESRRRSDSEGSEAFLAELESELHADIESDQVEPTTTRIPQRSATEPQGRHSSAFSEVSDVDSDALADLERELEQSVSFAPSRASTKVPAKVPPPSQRKRAQKPPATVKKASRAPVSSQKPADAPRIEKRRAVSKRVRSNSVASGVSFAESWAASSIADSDGLAEIQAELDAIPSVAWPMQAPSKTAPRVNTYQQHTPKTTANLPAAKPRAKPSARQATSRKRNSSTAIVKHDQLNQTTQMLVQHAESSSRALSVVSDTSELMQLQAELDFAAAPLAKTASSAPSIRASTPAVQPRRSSRLSSVASEADSNALEELEKELQATAAVLAPTQRSSAKTPRKRGAVPSKRPAHRTIAARSSAKKTRLNHVNSPVVSAVHQPLAGQKPSNTSGKQPVSKPTAVAMQASSRISSASSDTESDGLAELVAELEVKTSSTAQKKRKPSTEKTTRPAARKKMPVASNVATPRPVSVRPKALDHTPAPVVAGLRRSARLSSLASDTESDGLEDLMAELNTAPGAALASKPPKNTEKPKARRRAAGKQLARSQATKTRSTTRSKQATKTTMKVKSVAASATSRVTRTVSATRQTQATTNRSTPKTVATQRPTRQTPPETLPSSRRSTRSSSVAFDSDSDGLAELEAELQAGPS